MIDKTLLSHGYINLEDHAVTTSDFTSNTEREVGGILSLCRQNEIT